MKTIILITLGLFLAIVLLSKCGRDIESDPEFRDVRIEGNVIEFLKNNKHKIEVQNFELVYNNLSKQMACPYKLRDLISVTGDQASISVHFGGDKSQEFLDEYYKKGTLTMYGINFSVAEEEVKVESSKYVFNNKYSEEIEHIKLEEIANEKKIANLDHFYKNTMRPRQIANKHKCQ